MKTNKRLVTSTFYKNVIKQFVTVALFIKKKKTIVNSYYIFKKEAIVNSLRFLKELILINQPFLSCISPSQYNS